MATAKSKTSEKDRLLNEKPSQYSVEAQEEASTVSKEDEKSSILVTAFLLMLFFQLGNRIFGRLQTFPMHNYPLFTNMLSIFIYIPTSFAYIWPMMAYTNVISKEQTEIPKYKFGVMGFCDSVAGIMQTFAVNYITNSSTIVLVQQSAIPISMVISKIALAAEYTRAQYVGAGIVLLGIVVVLIPTLFGSSSSSSSSGDDQSSNSNELMWILIMVVSCVPMCLSSVYKEKALGETEINVVYLNGWVAVFQFFFAIPLCFPSATLINLTYAEIMPNMMNGAKCWFGINTIMESVESEGIWKDDCASAPFYVNTYLAFNIVFNILIIVILKHGSANILWMASTVIVPLSNIAFSLDFMPGHKPLTVFDTVGLIVIMAGLMVYRFMVPISRLYRKLTGQWSDDDETEAELAAQLAGKAAEGTQTKFLGINQVEALNTLIDSRVMKAQRKSLFRTPQQIRGTLLLKLGIPPSPMITMASRNSPSQNPNSRTSPQVSSAAMSPRTDRSKLLVSPLPRAPRSMGKPADRPDANGIANAGKKKGTSAEI